MPTGKLTDNSIKASHPGGRCIAGFTYIGILITIAILGVVLARVGIIWHTLQQRENERELIFVGDQFRLAIKSYYNVGKNVSAAGQYPQTLQDLVRDPRLLGVVRHIRKIYYDPITHSQQWGLVKNPQGRIIGVFSKSKLKPIKQANFPPADKDFTGKQQYAQWLFIYSPRKTPGNPALTGQKTFDNNNTITRNLQ